MDLQRASTEVTASAPAAPPTKARLLWIIVAAVAAVYVCLAVFALHGDGVAPAWTDEVFYVVSARSFAENGILQDAILIQESTSRWLDAGSHGFGYTLLDGLVARVTGLPWQAKLGMNGLCVVAAIGLLTWFRQRAAPGLLPVTILVLLTSFLLPIYLFTFMQETLQLFIAVAVWFALRATAQAERRWRTLLALMVLLSIASLARPNWMLAAVGLLPLARSWREGLHLGMLAIVGLSIAVVVTLLFHAPFPTGFFREALHAAAQDGWREFAARVLQNCRLNLSHFFIPGSSANAAYKATKFVYVAVAAWLLVAGLRSGHPLAVSVGIAMVVQLLALFLFYDAHSWREHRALGPFLVLGGVALVTCWPGRAALVFLVVSALIWACGIRQHAVPFMVEHRLAAVYLGDRSEQAAALAEIAGAVSDSGSVTILLPPTYLADPMAMLALPVRSAGGGPIRYTINRRGAVYARHGRISVEYALLPPGVTLPAATALLHTPHFTLVRLPAP